MTPRRRGFLAALAAWVFGLASTVLLIALWGRAVVVDTAELADSLDPLARSALVADRLSGWLEEELVESGVDPVHAGDASAQAMASPRLIPILEDVVTATVMAMAADDPDGAVVDVAGILSPRAGDIAVALGEAGLAVSQPQVESAVTELEPLVVRDPSRPPSLGPASPLATNLGTAALAGGLAMFVSGWAYAALSRDPVRAVRSLFHRFGLGALSFAVMLRIGSWITDPRGGRAPVGETVSNLAGSKGMLPFLLGLGALAGGGALWALRRRVRPGEEFLRRGEPATPRPGARL